MMDSNIIEYVPSLTRGYKFKSVCFNKCDFNKCWYSIHAIFNVYIKTYDMFTNNDIYKLKLLNNTKLIFNFT